MTESMKSFESVLSAYAGWRIVEYSNQLTALVPDE